MFVCITRRDGGACWRGCRRLWLSSTWYWSLVAGAGTVAGTDDVSSFVMLEMEGMVNQVCAVRGPSKEER